jgi:hypothetical protein
MIAVMILWMDIAVSPLVALSTGEKNFFAVKNKLLKHDAIVVALRLDITECIDQGENRCADTGQNTKLMPVPSNH